MQKILSLLVCLAAAAGAAPGPVDIAKLPPAVEREIDFLKDVDPIFKQRCYTCHGDDVVMNGYSLWRKKDAVRGGYSGTPAIVDRDSAASRLIHIVAGLEENLIMPPAGGQLSAEEIGVLRAWIDQGTPFAAERFDDSTRKDEQPWLHMDYGPVISAAVTVREPEDPRADKGPGDNISYKAHAILLDAKRESGVIFDTELLRMAAGWTNGPLVLTGTVYDWKHGPHPYLAAAPAFETPTAPGWARDGSFVDPRAAGFGPLPADWAQYRGLYRYGDKVVLSYTVGKANVLELPGISRDWGLDLLSRTIEIGPTAEPLLLAVAGAGDAAGRPAFGQEDDGGQGRGGRARRSSGKRRRARARPSASSASARKRNGIFPPKAGSACASRPRTTSSVSRSTAAQSAATAWAPSPAPYATLPAPSASNPTPEAAPPATARRSRPRASSAPIPVRGPWTRSRCRSKTRGNRGSGREISTSSTTTAPR